MKENGKQKLVGIVTPSKWDHNFKATEFYLAQPGEINIPLLSNEKLDQVRHWKTCVVELSGQMIGDSFYIENFIILNSFEGEQK